MFGLGVHRHKQALSHGLDAADRLCLCIDAKHILSDPSTDCPARLSAGSATIDKPCDCVADCPPKLTSRITHGARHPNDPVIEGKSRGSNRYAGERLGYLSADPFGVSLQSPFDD